MSKEPNTISNSATTEPVGHFELPGRLLNHLRLFTDLDIRIYLTTISILRPKTTGDIRIDSMASELSVTQPQVLRSLLRLMAFGVIKIISLNNETIAKQIELLPDRLDLRDHIGTDDTQPLKIAEMLNDTNNLPIYEMIARSVPPETIQNVMSEVMAVPAERIRKSRAALFIHLIRKYAKPTDTPDSN